MTREEAIKYLNEFIIFKKISNITEEETVECFELAVEALKKQPCEDCVSREAVLSIIKSICFSEEYLQFRVDNGSNGQRDAVINCIKALPSVSPQPSERTEEGTETHACDCISRKLMMDMGATCIAARNKDGDLVALGALDILPSVNLQPKTGHWEWVQYDANPNIGNWHCSECSCILRGETNGGPVRLPKYCPECGAKMEAK